MQIEERGERRNKRGGQDIERNGGGGQVGEQSRAEQSRAEQRSGEGEEERGRQDRTGQDRTGQDKRFGRKQVPSLTVSPTDKGFSEKSACERTFTLPMLLVRHNPKGKSSAIGGAGEMGGEVRRGTNRRSRRRWERMDVKEREEAGGGGERWRRRRRRRTLEEEEEEEKERMGESERSKRRKRNEQAGGKVGEDLVMV